MSGVNDNDAVVQWRERGEALIQCVSGRSKRGTQLAEEVVERLVNQEKDIEALLSLLVQERERNEVLRAGQPGFSERNTQDGELERLRDYAVSIRLREVELEKKLNGERQKVARLEAELIAARV
ncbi:hypothetical protein OIU34_19955 [Pararhizobium sp. BT-229]|uniref:hypothetical protein n=1 Tax=Pararhizobium sp. BT-229 TaxID=2986923 RepID=UPI0021F6F285|nr:hypothetical protein [Pararhizobium sp. BT-229]MCV9964161.1 hypothetical protein [Pararhizobium sp. BT-229]